MLVLRMPIVSALMIEAPVINVFISAPMSGSGVHGLHSRGS